MANPVGDQRLGHDVHPQLITEEEGEMGDPKKDASYALGARHAKEGAECRTSGTITAVFGRLTDGETIHDDDAYTAGYRYEQGVEDAKEGRLRETDFLGSLMFASNDERDAYGKGYKAGQED